MKPPVDAPTSRQRSPAGSTANARSAVSSFSPPRDTYRGGATSSTAAPAGTAVPALVTTAPSTSTRPAMISAWARLRDSVRPRSAIHTSSRVGARHRPNR